MKVYNARPVYSFSIKVFSEGFTCCKVINAFKQQNSWTDPFPESSTSLHQSFLSFLHKIEHGVVTGSNFHPQFPWSPLVTRGTMIPLLARTQARLTTYFSDLCFKSLANIFFFSGEQVPYLNSKDSSFVTVTKTKGHYQSFAPVRLMTRHLMKLVFRPLFHIARTYVTMFLTLPSATRTTNLTSY